MLPLLAVLVREYMDQSPATPGSSPRRFPSHSLRPVGGEIQAIVWENPNVGLERNLFWSFQVKFAAFRYGDAGEIAPSLAIEWIRLPIRDWRALEGTRLRGEYGQGGVEASFYVWEHDFAAYDLEILEREGASFRVRINLTVEFTGYDESDRDPKMPVSAECWLPFRGILVPDALLPSSDDPRAACAMVTEFADLAAYHAPERGATTFTPRVNAS